MRITYEAISACLQDVLKDTGIHLYEIVLSPKKKSIEVFIDEPGGMNISRCGQIHRGFVKSMPEGALDEYDISFCTPGLTRKLQFPIDFKFYPDKKVRLHMSSGDKISGLVSELLEDEEKFSLTTEDGTVHSIEWAEVKKAKFEIGF